MSESVFIHGDDPMEEKLHAEAKDFEAQMAEEHEKTPIAHAFSLILDELMWQKYQLEDKVREDRTISKEDFEKTMKLLTNDEAYQFDFKSVLEDIMDAMNNIRTKEEIE